MERIEALINKLKQQFEQQADPNVMAGTVQLLQFELTKLAVSSRQNLGTSKVAVVLPSTSATVNSLYEKYGPRPVAPLQEKEEIRQNQEVQVPAMVQQVVEHSQQRRETVLVEDDAFSFVQKNGQLDMVFDPMTEIPTLSQQLQPREINEHQQRSESMNDRLKQGKTELLEIYKGTPIKDLRKAVGINERFVFINELFRGDENMYDRSIKTINSFNILAEAEYWISRELKLKLGWKNDNDTVLNFDQLVRRRFS